MRERNSDRERKRERERERENIEKNANSSTWKILACLLTFLVKLHLYVVMYFSSLSTFNFTDRDTNGYKVYKERKIQTNRQKEMQTQINLQTKSERERNRQRYKPRSIQTKREGERDRRR